MTDKKIREIGEWISVDERLPDGNQQCIIFTKIHFIPDHVDDPDYYYGIEISTFYEDLGFISANGRYAEFWMPLPEPPKEAEDELSF